MKKRIRTLIIILLQTFMLVRLSAQTSHTISGIVKDKEAAPISGVSIQVDGQKWKASTGKEGKFTLEIPQIPSSLFPPSVMKQSLFTPVKKNGWRSFSKNHKACCPKSWLHPH